MYVGNLGTGAGKGELERAFGYYGPLRTVWIARNPPGFAFVEFEDPRDADDAVRGLDGKSVPHTENMYLEPCTCCCCQWNVYLEPCTCVPGRSAAAVYGWNSRPECRGVPGTSVRRPAGRSIRTINATSAGRKVTTPTTVTATAAAGGAGNHDDGDSRSLQSAD